MTAIMGIVNVTPDSFLESSRAESPEKALRLIADLRAAGADIIDIGAVSSRPGASAVERDIEWARLRPVMEAVAAGAPSIASAPSAQGHLGGLPPVSVDTTDSVTVRRCFRTLGQPFIVNDISAGSDDGDMLRTVAELHLPYVAMHKRGTPQTMDSLCDYPDGVMRALLDFFEEFSQKASEAGVEEWILDPGLGFAKTPEQCMEILLNLGELKRFGRPILVGASHKRFGSIFPPHPQGISAELTAIKNGADMLRLHDVSQISAVRAAEGNPERR